VKIAGSLFFIYLILAGLERFSVEFIRTNEKYLFYFFSGSQIISILMMLIGTYFLLNPIITSEKDAS
jgi:prolipoprotein diacylglyceryltransferase